MRQINLREYQRCNEPVLLSREERDALAEAIPSVSIEPASGHESHYFLTPSSTIGVVEIGDLAIQILPKLPIDRVLFLISYAIDPKDWQNIGFDLEQQSSIVEAVIPAFTMHVRQALRRGILQGYQVREDALATVRGQIRFGDQIRDRYGIVPPVEVRYDEFTEDIVENQLIKAATGLLLRKSIRSHQLRTDLRAIESALQNVTHQHFAGNQLPEVQFTRLNERYRSAIELAKLIVRFSSFDIQHGNTRASSFLVDMNQVFEDFVVVALREALGLTKHSFPQNADGRRVRLDEAERVVLKPDISWWQGRRCCFVGDVKYKKTNAAGIKHADLYQLLAYTVATDLPKGLLIYAAGEDEPRTHEVKFAGKTLTVMALDLAGAPADVLMQIKRVAMQIRNGARVMHNKQVSCPCDPEEGSLC
jgi:5-methylcytosine-specific restriction enzyme subunit McrC